MKSKLVNSKILFAASLFLLADVSLGAGIKATVENKSVRIGTSFVVSSGTQMYIPGDLAIATTNSFKNSGSLLFRSESGSTITLPSGDLGSGEFSFTGNKSYDLVINTDGQARIGDLTMNMSGGSFSLDGDLVVANQLNLNSGIVNVKEISASLLVENTAPEAVTFSNSPISVGYVSGYLSRKVAAGKRYEFPVGDATNFHPFLIDKPEKADLLSVSFDRTVPTDMLSVGSPAIPNVQSSLGWRVESDLNGQNKFIPGLSVYNTELDEFVPQLEVVYLSDVTQDGSISATSKDDSYIRSLDPKSSGMFAFNEVKAMKLVNFIFVGDGNNTKFEVPNADEYTSISLKVYNSLGSKVFQSDSYVSEFDARDYPDGTYYYELTMVKDNVQSVIRKFIDINHAK